MTTALVTGGSGFVGGNLIKRLVREGWHVRALHRSPADAERLRALDAEPVQGDLEDMQSLNRALAGMDVVFHAAALFKMWAAREEFERANVEGTRNLLSAAQAAGVGRFIQIGAAGAVMGNPEDMRGVTEDWPLAYPAWAPYLASKARAQDLMLRANGGQSMRTTVILPPMIWGAGMPMLEGVIVAVRERRFALPGGGRQTVSLAHVDNVCEAAMLAAEHSPGGRAYFVTDGETRTMREVLTGFLATQNVHVEPRSVPFPVAWLMATVMESIWRTFRRPGEPPITRQLLRMIGFDFVASDQRARTELGYAPIVGWGEGIEAMRIDT